MRGVRTERFRLRRWPSGLGMVAVLGMLSWAPTAWSAPSLVVVPKPTGGSTLSYFKLTAGPGRVASAGTVELRNPTGRTLRVALAPVAGETASTLGSTYAPPRQHLRHAAPATWLRLGARRVNLAAGERASVAVIVAVPAAARPGDYLAGVSIEALDQQAQTAPRKGVSIASVVRYAIGAEVTVPGPRQPLVTFSGAALHQEPSGLVFLLQARNAGNVILKSVQGGASITTGHRVVLRAPLGPGTFVTGTSIAYPLLTPREHPRPGTVYRIRAILRYAGGVARLNTTVRYGRADAVIRQAYSGPGAAGSSGPSALLIAGLSVLGCAMLAGAVYGVRRMRAGGRLRSPLRTLDAALVASRRDGRPLNLIVVTAGLVAGGSRELVAAMNSRLRQADRLCRLEDGRFLVIAPDTDYDSAKALADDLQRHIERTDYDGHGVKIEVQQPDRAASAAELLRRIDETSASPSTH